MSRHIKGTKRTRRNKESEIKEQKKKLTEKQKNGLLIAGCVVIILLAALLAVYPLISNYVNQKNNSTVITEYVEAVAEMDTSSRDQMLAEAQVYNEVLVSSALDDANSSTTENEYGVTLDDYYNILNVNVSGLIGYVEIPSIGVYLPIYHGTSDTVLQKGAGHIEGTSFPIGGESTHAVISAHSGLTTQKMFTDLEDVEIGDIFYIHVLDITLAYEVAEIDTVLPEDVEVLEIEEGADKVTLLTCSPFSVNTHRLLVTGYRTEYVEAAEDEATETTEEETSPTGKWMREYYKGILNGVEMFLAELLIIFILKRTGAAQYIVTGSNTIFRTLNRRTRSTAKKQNTVSAPVSDQPSSDATLRNESIAGGEQEPETNNGAGEAGTKSSQEAQL